MFQWLGNKLNMSIQQENFNLEREEMNWDLRRQQIQS